MEKILALISGKKVYIVAILTAITAGLQALGYVIPEWVYVLEGALGLGAIRAAVAKVEVTP